ncbi:PilW family protein [Thiocapsa bogorovii]|uniref:PilW family protein n=1 Tax=Thiocapsa bogorovii TaxID=521689 RepID=UPI001E365B49|nr:PilW family protein [Thiocapsa bogorovii]UHD17898.1 PilW family protein [Thiocapsa bogorovii]
MEAVSRSQENGRYAFDLLGRTVRMAGFIGCARLGDRNLQVHVANVDGLSLSLDAGTIISGLDDVASGTLVGGRLVTSGTDQMTVRGGGGSFAHLTKAMSAGNEDVALRINRNADRWDKMDILIISDCSSVDVFQATKIVDKEDTKGFFRVQHDALSKAYLLDADVMSYIDTTFFISDCENVEPGAPPCRAIWRFKGGRPVEDGNPAEVLPGIHDMQILYGVDTSGAPGLEAYQTAAEVNGNWGNVVAVRIALLLVSAEDNLVDSPQAIPFNGALLEPDDHRLRRVETATIAIRNRLP